MATMHIKNKYEVSLKELIEATKKKGGMPDRIDISPQEAWDILREIHFRGRNTPFSISTEYHTTSTQFEVTSRLINKKDPIELEEAQELILKWMRGEFTVFLQEIPIHVKREKPPVTTESSLSTKTKIPENKPVKWWQFWG